MNIGKQLLLLAGTAFAFSATASAQVLVFEEYFDYDGTLNNNENIANAPGWTGGTNNIRYRDSSQGGQLSFTGTGYVPTHAGGYLNSGQSNSSDWRGSNAALGQALSGEFWISAFVNPVGMTNDNGSITLLSLNTGGTSNSSPNGQGFGVYNSGGGTLNFVVANGLSIIETGPSATANTWNLVLARVNINESADDQVDLWFYGDDASVPVDLVSLGAPHLTSDTIDWGDSINTINVGGQSIETTGGKEANWDDLRVSARSGQSGLEDVLGIPEPRVYAAIFGVFALGFVLWRRRRG
ncbi:MAG: hypothetical protein JJU00_00300 [Opitutales bacterium]|nr:hypothetical protein [Opitutales bacterium]